jgi:hypothetical protein
MCVSINQEEPSLLHALKDHLHFPTTRVQQTSPPIVMVTRSYSLVSPDNLMMFALCFRYQKHGLITSFIINSIYLNAAIAAIII